MSALMQLATFRIGPQLFGVEVRRVQEVLRFQTMTAVPHAPSAIAGLINLRGQIVTAVDLRERFDQASDGRVSEPMNVVVCVDGEICSLLVDDVGDVVEIEAGLLDAPPATLRGVARGLVRGVHQLEEELLLLLDVEQVVNCV